jgi:hypothetical protein
MRRIGKLAGSTSLKFSVGQCRGMRTQEDLQRIGAPLATPRESFALLWQEIKSATWQARSTLTEKQDNRADKTGEPCLKGAG